MLQIKLVEATRRQLFLANNDLWVLKAKQNYPCFP